MYFLKEHITRLPSEYFVIFRLNPFKGKLILHKNSFIVKKIANFLFNVK